VKEDLFFILCRCNKYKKGKMLFYNLQVRLLQIAHGLLETMRRDHTSVHSNRSLAFLSTRKRIAIGYKNALLPEKCDFAMRDVTRNT